MINYSLAQKYLHHFILGNNFVKKSLFDIEKIIFLDKHNDCKSQKHIFKHQKGPKLISTYSKNIQNVLFQNIKNM